MICAGGVGLHARPLEVAAKDVLPHQIDDEMFHTHRLSGFRGYAVGSIGHVGYYEGTGSRDQDFSCLRRGPQSEPARLTGPVAMAARLFLSIAISPAGEGGAS